MLALRTVTYCTENEETPKSRGFTVTTRRDKRHTPASDLVNRRFNASDSNQLWVADMTYIPAWMGFLYLAKIINV